VICKSANPTADSPICSTSGEWEQGWIMFVDNDDNQARHTTNERTVRVGEPLGGNNTVRASLEDMDDYVSYRPTGLVSPAPDAGDQAVFYFCDERGEGKARGVVIENTGRAVTVRQNETVPLSCP
jgi:type IV fimbrial biogenesis protein FimT